LVDLGRDLVFKLQEVVAELVLVDQAVLLRLHEKHLLLLRQIHVFPPVQAADGAKLTLRG